ncbi:MAG: beta-propeller domain-containing protein, partial [Syntrophomonadaceae bacterium]|nr:beta-propeller domain-containing protein [Syntrophomonadaceae bacterium]
PGEKIYSVRFMGERCYLVTFEKVDPFFVIDLKDPQNPRMLGALKIPGYSDYLHPYDENHIIGFGKDTVELPVKDRQGNMVRTQAYYLGMKIAIFDVSNVSSPKEMFCEKIGDRGTDSELLHNHKALLFSRDKNLLAFPITVMEVKNGPAIRPDRNYPEHGSFTFQGACIYQVDLDGGFSCKGRITHLTPEDYLKAGNYCHDRDKFVERIIYIGDTLYTLSPSQIRAHGMSGLEERGALSLNQK